MKYFGKIGFLVTEQIKPGIWVPKITEREYYGDVLRNSRRWTSTSEKLNDDLTISNEISILADSYIQENLGALRYAEFCGTKWKITDIEISYPRLTLTLGGEYNGES